MGLQLASRYEPVGLDVLKRGRKSHLAANLSAGLSSPLPLSFDLASDYIPCRSQT